MSLPLLLVLVLVGVSLVVGAVHLAGGSRKHRISNEDEARQRFFEDFPEFSSDKIILGTDHNVAVLLNDSSKAAGLVVVMGVHSLTRLLDHSLLNSVTRSNQGLVFGLADMTLPIVDIVLGNADDVDEIERQLKKIITDRRAT